MKQYRLCQVFTLLSFGIVYAFYGERLATADLILIGGAYVLSWLLTAIMIPKLAVFMLNVNKFGYDINKKGSKAGEKKIPQCIGFASATAFCIVSFVFCAILSKMGQRELLFEHTSCTLTIAATIILGFADDMIDLQWRYKLIFPFFIVMPAVVSYSGSTSIYLPYPISIVFGSNLDIGMLYFVYLAMLGIYCTNAINIYAGINGLQVGQSIIAAASSLILFGARAYMHPESPINYMYSIFILANFLGSALALMKKNAYPSTMFVGDTFCYFAGIVLAISAMIGETSIIFHFLFIPQLINFLYSLPQLFGIVPCPRHRLTVYDVDKDILHPIVTNMNLLNLSLRILGPTNEGVLCNKLLVFQIICSAFPIVLTLMGIC